MHHILTSVVFGRGDRGPVIIIDINSDIFEVWFNDTCRALRRSQVLSCHLCSIVHAIIFIYHKLVFALILKSITRLAGLTIHESDFRRLTLVLTRWFDKCGP